LIHCTGSRSAVTASGIEYLVIATAAAADADIDGINDGAAQKVVCHDVMVSRQDCSSESIAKWYKRKCVSVLVLDSTRRSSATRTDWLRFQLVDFVSSTSVIVVVVVVVVVARWGSDGSKILRHDNLVAQSSGTAQPGGQWQQRSLLGGHVDYGIVHSNVWHFATTAAGTRLDHFCLAWAQFEPSLVKPTEPKKSYAMTTWSPNKPVPPIAASGSTASYLAFMSSSIDPSL
jgi:hypothetical protein